jgi:hypothetical protein
MSCACAMSCAPVPLWRGWGLRGGCDVSSKDDTYFHIILSCFRIIVYSICILICTLHVYFTYSTLYSAHSKVFSELGVGTGQRSIFTRTLRVQTTSPR